MCGESVHESGRGTLSTWFHLRLADRVESTPGPSVTTREIGLMRSSGSVESDVFRGRADMQRQPGPGLVLNLQQKGTVDEVQRPPSRRHPERLLRHWRGLAPART